MVGGLLRRKAISIGIAEAHFQAVAHAVAGLGHRVVPLLLLVGVYGWLLYEGTL